MRYSLERRAEFVSPEDKKDKDKKKPRKKKRKPGNGKNDLRKGRGGAGHRNGSR